MGVNKMAYFGRTVFDITDATATADKLISGYTAYGADGSKITGTAQVYSRTERDITLPVSGWSNGMQTAAAPGVTAGNDVIILPDRWGVYCTGQSAGALEFTATVAPTENVTVHIIIFDIVG